MRILKYVFAAVFTVQLLLVTSGCISKEMDKRVFVACIGIDKGEKNPQQFRVTLTIVIPQKQMTEYFDLVADANTIAQAVDIIKAQISKDVDFSYTKIILFGKSLAENDLSIAMDWIMRIRGMQSISFVALGSPDAKSILDQRVKLQEKSSGMVLAKNSLILAFDGSATETNYITQVYLFDLFRRMSEPGLDPYLPIIKLDKDHFKIDQLALFGKGAHVKIKTIFSPQETQIFNMIARDKSDFSLYVDTTKSNFIIRVTSVKHNYSIRTNAGVMPEIMFNLKVTGVIGESTNPFNPIDLKDCEQSASKFLKDKVQKMLKELQAEDIDPMGFGLRYLSKSWNNSTKLDIWNEYYPKINFKVNSKVNLKSSGLIK